MARRKVVVTGFLRKGDTVLLVKRSDDEKSLPGYFEMPGGTIDFGETPEEALLREFQEEVGIDIEIFDPFNVFSYISWNDKKHSIKISYQVRAKNIPEKIILSHAHTSYMWAKENELDSLTMTKESRHATKKGFSLPQV